MSFWREGVTDEKSGQKFLRSIFNPTHHFVLLCLDFLAVRMAFVRNQKMLWWEIWLVGSGRFLAKTHLRYLQVCKVL